MLFINSTTDEVIQHDNREITEQNHAKEEGLVETAHDPQPSSLPTIFSLAANRSKFANAFAAENITKRLEGILTEQELKSFVPIIEDPQIDTVTRRQGLSTWNPTPLFEINGYLFPVDPEFPTFLGYQFFLSDEEEEIYPNGAYRVHVTLTSPYTGKSRRFTSNIVSVNETEVIIKAEELDRKFHAGPVWDYDRGSVNEIELLIRYRLTLEDGTNYTYTLQINRDYTEFNEANIKAVSDLNDNFKISEGDIISNFRSNYFFRYFYEVDLNHWVDGQLEKYGSGSLIGEKGAETRFSFNSHRSNQQLIIRSNGVTETEDFGELGAKYTGLTHTNLPKTCKKMMTRVGFFTQKGYRMHVFLDEEGNYAFINYNKFV